MRERIATTVDVDPSLEQTRLTLEERGCGGASLIDTYAGAAPPQPRGQSPPWSEAEGFAAADDAKRQREQPTGGYGTPKGAAGLARHVPGRAKNEPLRADDVTGQTSDCRCTTKARATARLLRGRFHSSAKPHSAPISRRRDGAVHRRLKRVGVRCLSRQRPSLSPTSIPPMSLRAMNRACLSSLSFVNPQTLQSAGLTPLSVARGRLQSVFESAAKLPRRQQEKVAEFLEAFVERQSSGP